MTASSTRARDSAPFPTHQQRARALALLVAALALGCADGAGPSLGFLLRTEVSPQWVTAGDTATLRAIMTNPGTLTINVSQNCGPPIFFEIRAPDGTVGYPYRLDAIYTCEGRDYHVLDPGETDTVSFRWVAAVPNGEYAIRSGLAAPGGGLQFLTKPASVLVRQGSGGS